MSRLQDLAATMYYVADSLRELDKILSLPRCEDCAKYGGCEYLPEWGRPTRYNCPLWEKNEYILKQEV